MGFTSCQNYAYTFAVTTFDGRPSMIDATGRASFASDAIDARVFFRL